MLETSTLSNPVARFVRVAAAVAWSRLTRQPKSQLGTRVNQLIGDAHLSAGSLPLLGMGRDIPDRTMRLRGGWLDVDWTTATSKAFFARLRRLMADVAGALDAGLVESPLSCLNRVVTVHPLGGRPMGRHIGEGVVDTHGEVFAYPGLFVADGSVMPGPVGANPALTISALAERFSTRMIDRSAPDG